MQSDNQELPDGFNEPKNLADASLDVDSLYDADNMPPIENPLTDLEFLTLRQEMVQARRDRLAGRNTGINFNAPLIIAQRATVQQRKDLITYMRQEAITHPEPPPANNPKDVRRN